MIIYDKPPALLLQISGIRDRRAQRRHGQLHAGPQDRLHPAGEPLRAGAAPGAGQRAPPRLPQGQGPPRRIVRITSSCGNNCVSVAIGCLAHWLGLNFLYPACLTELGILYLNSMSMMLEQFA